MEVVGKKDTMIALYQHDCVHRLKSELQKALNEGVDFTDGLHRFELADGDAVKLQFLNKNEVKVFKYIKANVKTTLSGHGRRRVRERLDFGYDVIFEAVRDAHINNGFTRKIPRWAREDPDSTYHASKDKLYLRIRDSVLVLVKSGTREYTLVTVLTRLHASQRGTRCAERKTRH